MVCLGIESSCDETALALVNGTQKISHAIASQAELHALFGGVVPEIASRKHYSILPHLAEQVFANTPYTYNNLSCIAVTRGPGLLGSLLVGIAFAKGISFATQTPLIGVNHLHAHILGVGLEHTILYPAMGILLSGGHTYIYYIASPVDIRILGKTIDDAVGEVFDKIGKMLGMPYPAGKLIDDCAQRGVPEPKCFTPPYLHNTTLDFSFSGLKTQALQYIQQHPECRICSKDPHSFLTNPHVVQICANICYTIQYTITEKVRSALRYCSKEQLPVASIVLGGGVGANSHIRNALASLATEFAIPLLCASMELCADNALMIAHTGQLLHNTYGYTHTSTLSAIPRGQIVPNDFLIPHSI